MLFSGSMACALTPKFFQPFVPAAAIPIGLVVKRILFVVFLMVLFRRVESAGRGNLCGNGLAEPFAPLQSGFRGFCQPGLLFRMVENCASVLVSRVAELAVDR